MPSAGSWMPRGPRAAMRATDGGNTVPGIRIPDFDRGIAKKARGDAGLQRKRADNSARYAPPPTLGPQRIGRDSPKSAALIH